MATPPTAPPAPPSTPTSGAAPAPSPPPKPPAIIRPSGARLFLISGRETIGPTVRAIQLLFLTFWLLPRIIGFAADTQEPSEKILPLKQLESIAFTANDDSVLITFYRAQPETNWTVTIRDSWNVLEQQSLPENR